MEEAKRFVGQLDDGEILNQLQHYGHPTNLIDFTTDWNIALFFACDGQMEQNGRVILMDRTSYPSREPRSPQNRIVAQKSVFVCPSKGYIEQYDAVIIPSELKGPILDYLRTSHGLTAATLYNDIHGFIKFRTIHESAYTEFYAGLAQHERGNSDKAIEYYNKSIKLNPREPTSFNNRGIAYSERNEYDRAIQDFDKAIELHPPFAEPHYGRAITFVRRGEYDRAVQDFNRAFELKPPDAEDYFNRGSANMGSREYDLAIQDFDKAIELNPNYSGAYGNRGVAYSERSEYDRAIQDHDRAIELNPHCARAYNNRGNAYSELDDYERAIQDFDRAIELNPNYAEAYYNRGIAYGRKATWVGLVFPGKFRTSPYNRAIAHGRKDEYDLQVQDYDKAIELNPDYAKLIAIGVLLTRKRVNMTRRSRTTAGHRN